jgi:hypothetical protein
MFFIPETEDYFYRTRTPAEITRLEEQEERVTAMATDRFINYLAENASLAP